MGRTTPACLLVLGALLLACLPARAESPDCPTNATVARVNLVDGGNPVALRPGGVQLGDTIRITGAKLGALAACADSAPLVLFLGGRGFATLQPVAKGINFLDFELRVRPSAPGNEPDPWKLILGQPLSGDGVFPISVGLLGEAAITNHLPIRVDRVPRTWFFIWLAVFFGLLGVFLYCLHRTAILRDPAVDPDNPDALGTYSLARTQAAWWFFFILASYLLIGLVTGDFFTSLNGTALTLLGIGAGTAVLGSTIDATGATQDTTARKDSLQLKQPELAKLESDMAGGFQVRRNEAAAEIERLEQLPAPTADEAAALARKRTELADLDVAIRAAPMQKAALESQIRKLSGRSEGFIRDIVSDANGASFSRFQMVAWTVVLTVVFLRGVYTELAMPTFDLTLLGLMGLSAATYLGMKTNEPAAPTPH